MHKSLKSFAAATLAVGLFATAAAAEEVTIGHFGTPIPMHAAIAAGEFEKATGWKINWRKFGAGTEVIAAMASGDIKLSELGSSPLAIGATQGVDYQLFAISNVIGASEALVVRNGSGIETPADLKGKKIAVPLGSTAHFSLMGALEHHGIAQGDVEVLGMKPDQMVGAWEQAQIDGGYVWDPALAKMKASGKVLLHSGDVASWGNPTFDGWVVNREFAEQNPDFLIAFIKVLDQINGAYNANPAAWDAGAKEVQAIAAQTGAKPEDVAGTLSGYSFLASKDQASAGWLGGAVAANMLKTSKFLAEQKRIDSALDDYTTFVNAKFVEAASQ